ncbi:hypothetical protein ACMZ6Y_07160 [Streptococcus pluranimalium]
MKTGIKAIILFLAGIFLFSLSNTNKVLADEPISYTNNINNFSEEQWGNELEYIFTYLYSENESGKYIANQENIDRSPYSQEEKDSISRFINYLNSEETGASGNTMFRSSSWFERCLADTYKISKPSIDAIVRDIKRKDFWSAGSKLFTAIKASELASKHPKLTIAMAVGYLSFCGANNVS